MYVLLINVLLNVTIIKCIVIVGYFMYAVSIFVGIYIHPHGFVYRDHLNNALSICCCLINNHCYFQWNSISMENPGIKPMTNFQFVYQFLTYPSDVLHNFKTMQGKMIWANVKKIAISKTLTYKVRLQYQYILKY